MKILTINCGSSSLKAEILSLESGDRLHTLELQRLGTPGASLEIDDKEVPLMTSTDNPLESLKEALNRFAAAIPKEHHPDAAGHRLVHGGAEFSEPVLINDVVLTKLSDLCQLAPLHLPANITGVKASMAAFPDIDHVGVFDTAFHNTLPRRARTYALPAEVRRDPAVRRFGFHGISHQWVASQAADVLVGDLRDLRLITCHLGNGASVCAIEYGRSVETSMGMTPLEGLVMGTRSGDIDPGLLVHLLRQPGMDVEKLDRLLNYESGLAGVSELGQDMRDIEEAAAAGDEKAQLALHVFCHRLRKIIGGYAAVMGGVDAIIVTAGIGENSALIRHRTLQRLEYLGAQLDEDRNRTARATDDNPIIDISTRNSRCRLLVVRTDEARAIAESTAKLVHKNFAVHPPSTIPVAISARHVHLTQEHVEALFGPGYQLTHRNDLSQPGQFAAVETVDLIGPRRTIEGVRILGPTRPETQVEVSRTDEFMLGIDAPVRASGDIDNSPGITLRGPAGEVTIERGVICAWRHIHMTPDDAKLFGVKDRDVVEVAIQGGPRDLIFGDVLIRVSPNYKLEMHIDTDEGNAAELEQGSMGMLRATSGMAKMRKRKSLWDTA